MLNYVTKSLYVYFMNLSLHEGMYVHTYLIVYVYLHVSVYWCMYVRMCCMYKYMCTHAYVEVCIYIPRFRNHSTSNIFSLGLLHYATTNRKGMSHGANLLTTHALNLLLYLQEISYVPCAK